MKDYFAPPPPKPFDYAAFIADIERLIEQGSNVGAMRRAHTSSSFRAWKHEVEDAIERIRRLRYSINCGIETRHFRTLSTSATDKQDSIAYERDFEDTINELTLIVTNFKKYGDPKSKGDFTAPAVKQDAEAVSVVVPAEPLKPPEKVTVRWIQDHVSAAWLWTIGVGSVTALAFAFSFGLTAAGTKAGQSIIAWFTPTTK